MTSSPWSHLIVPDSGVSPKRFWLSRSSCSLPAPSAIRPKCQSMLARLLSPRCTISGSLSFSPNSTLRSRSASPPSSPRIARTVPIPRSAFAATSSAPSASASASPSRASARPSSSSPEIQRRFASATRTKAFVRDGGRSATSAKASLASWIAESISPRTQRSCATMVSASAATSSWPEASATSCAS